MSAERETIFSRGWATYEQVADNIVRRSEIPDWDYHCPTDTFRKPTAGDSPMTSDWAGADTDGTALVRDRLMMANAHVQQMSNDLAIRVHEDDGGPYFSKDAWEKMLAKAKPAPERVVSMYPRRTPIADAILIDALTVERDRLLATVERLQADVHARDAAIARLAAKPTNAIAEHFLAMPRSALRGGDGVPR